MTRFASHRAWALVFCAVSCLAVAASAKILVPEQGGAQADGITVVLADGWEFAGVQVHWFGDEGLLVVERDDGARRTFRPEDLAGLRDDKGRDVTRDILPAWAVQRLGGTMPPASAPPTEVPTTPPPTADPDPAPEPQWHELGGSPTTAEAVDPMADPRVVFGLEMGYSEPHDQHFGGYEGGFGFEATLRMQLAGPFYLMGGYLHQMLERPPYDVVAPCSPEFEDCVVVPPYGEDARIAGPWVGLSLVSTAEAPRPVRFYMEAGVGRFDVEELPVWNLEDGYLGYRFGTGFLIPVGDQAALDLGVRALHMKDLDFGWGDETDHTMLGLRAGISLLGY